MDIVEVIIGVVLVGLMVLVLRKSGGDGEQKKLREMEERMIRMEGLLGQLGGQIQGEFRENRKEITNSMKDTRKEMSDSLMATRRDMVTGLRDTRTEISKSLTGIQESNEKKLEQMRETVDEKLKESVEKRFNESFKTISGQLTQVYEGLGEMKSLASGVGDLKKVMEGVKTRGMYGEVQLGAIISEMLNESQYKENFATIPKSSERVEFAVRMPGKEDDVYLPIDSKFPIENYSRLLDAYEHGDKDEIDKCRKALANDAKTQAKKIQTKYVEAPYTTDFGIMFVPTESLYAEILRIPGLAEELRSKFKISLASPSTLPVMLNGLLMGFRTVAIEKRSAEVWALLGGVKTQFGKFGDLLEGVEKKLGESVKKIGEAKNRSRMIEGKLKGVEDLPEAESVKMIGDLGEMEEE